ncbi:carboxy terminal-processing peptidase [Salinisphaera sp. G21_0]|uniref:carboxy terminal-processing peptidase n=1 Tax=Salinisphaera sp. G21_0 TaxID=2821094 RepID=UPI001ADAFB2D|nr:carboxy terminal-processing peptidase [Salinisphaera sp. G21_0]MBO9482462.1 carboxy terminal-processing peptidase [Salinisphaera sp. G21_0]
MISKLQPAKRMRLFFSALLFTALLSGNLAQAVDKDISQPVPTLMPNLQQAIASVHVVQLLSRSHYRKIPLDQSNMEKVFDRYLDRLDPNRSFFLQADIQEFEPYRKKLGDSLKSGDLNPAFAIFNRYRERAEERARFMLKQLELGINNLNLRKNEELVIERKDEPWLTSKQAQQRLWIKQFKDSVLSQKLNNKTDEEIINQLRRRNTNLLRRLHQSKSEDAFQTYINAFAGIYDPHTQYFSPQTAENFDINMSLSLEGIGAVLSAEDEYTRVVSVVPGGPAEKAGQLKPGDKIVSVGQGKKGILEDVVGMRLDDVVKLIRGAKHTLVRLEIIPGSSNDSSTRVYEIVRDRVKLEEQDAASKIIEVPMNGKTSRIGVIELPTFYIDFKAAQAGDPDYKSTTRDVRRLLEKLKKEKVDGLIIDLRGNGGGSLQEANELTGLFIDKGPTVVVRNNRGRAERQEDPDSEQLYEGPMVVMIDRLSASASEIFAGAMQDYGRALIVGSQSYGKGTVQSIQPLNHGQLKLTLAKFYRISGQSTQNRGVIPDIIFPSLYDGRDIGEDTLPDALPWDNISPVSYRPYANLSPYLPELQKKHEFRTRKNADFVYLHEMKDYFEHYENQKKVSLNQERRQLELQTMRSQRLAIENRLRKSRGLALLNNLDELEEINNQEQEQKKKDKEPDAFLKEAGVILTDMVKASNNKRLFTRRSG